MTRQSAFVFFHANAGNSWNPETETEMEGRNRSAQRLVDAEQWAWDQGIEYRWEEDVQPDRSGIDHNAPLWVCIAYHDGEIIESMGGIDLGEGDPWPNSSGRTYARVVEAELALDAMATATECEDDA